VIQSGKDEVVVVVGVGRVCDGGTEGMMLRAAGFHFHLGIKETGKE
jgi:hypothetical protein